MSRPPAVGNRSSSTSALRVGISRCLLGDEVRYDGLHKRSAFAVDVLGKQVDFVAVCPEVELGMPIPREPVRLERRTPAEEQEKTDNPSAKTALRSKMMAPGSGKDWTLEMNRFAKRRVGELAKLGLSGFILQQKSPSCGMERVKVFARSGKPRRVGSGLFAAKLMEQLPLLPVEEEGRLGDAALRENFLVRIFAYARLQQLLRNRWKRGEMIQFHADHEYLLRAHSPQKFKQLDQLVTAIRDYPEAEFRRLYAQRFMAILEMLATVKKNARVMQKMMGSLIKRIGAEEQRDLQQSIDDYQKQMLPLAVPLALLRHYSRLHPTAGLERQVYLDPHPQEWMLRNHA